MGSRWRPHGELPAWHLSARDVVLLADLVCGQGPVEFIARTATCRTLIEKPEITMIQMRPGALACLFVCLSACSANSAERPAVAATLSAPSGERLVYLVGCVNCHHQTPKEIINAPPLVIVRAYSLPEFKTLLKTGVTRDGRDMYAQGSIMGIVAREQFSHFTDQEVMAVHTFLQSEWTPERAAREEAKIAIFPPPTFMKK